MDFAALQGILPSQHIRRLLDLGHVFGAFPEHIKAASLELAITDEIYRMKGSYTPKPGERIRGLLKEGGMYQGDINNPLETGVTYLVRLHETLVLPESVQAESAPLYDTWISGAHTSLLCDGNSTRNSVASNFAGELWLEVTPQTSLLWLKPGDRLHELFFFTKKIALSSKEYFAAHAESPLLLDQEEHPVFAHMRDRAVMLTADLVPQADGTMSIAAHASAPVPLKERFRVSAGYVARMGPNGPLFQPEVQNSPPKTLCRPEPISRIIRDGQPVTSLRYYKLAQ